MVKDDTLFSVTTIIAPFAILKPDYVINGDIEQIHQLGAEAMLKYDYRYVFESKQLVVAYNGQFIDALPLNEKIAVGRMVDSGRNYSNQLHWYIGANAPTVSITAFDKTRYIIKFPNGFVDVRTKGLIPNSQYQKYLTTRQVGYDYDAGAVCPKFDSLLEEIMPNKYDRLFFWLSLAESFAGTKTHCIIILIGDGSNGKGQLLLIIKHVFDVYAGSFSTTNRNDFHNRRLLKRRLVIIPDADEKVLRDESILKQMIGEDILPIDLKNDNAEYDDSTARLCIIPTNIQLSSDKQLSQNLIDKITLLDFPHKFRRATDDNKDCKWFAMADEKKIANIIEDEKELQGIAAKLVDLAYKLYNGLTFYPDQSLLSTAKLKTTFLRAMRPIDAFIDDCASSTEDIDRETFPTIRQVYQQWCKVNKISVPTDRSLGTMLLDYGLDRKKDAGITFYYGIKIKPELLKAEFGLDQFSDGVKADNTLDTRHSWYCQACKKHHAKIERIITKEGDKIIHESPLFMLVERFQTT